jgi:outer membrane protein OmpA-like peptidoglycan-associated protein
MMRRVRLVCIALAVALAPVAARAQVTAAFDAQQFHPAIGARGYLSVDGAWVAPHLSVAPGLYFTWAHDPLVLQSSSSDGLHIFPGGELVRHQLGMDLVFSFSVIDRLEVGIDLPFSPYQQTDTSDANLPSLHAAGMGDLRLEIKAMVAEVKLPRTSAIGLSLIAGGTAPTGDQQSFLGQGAFTGRLRLVAEWRHRWASIAINLGAVLRTIRQYDSLFVGSQISWGAAARLRLPRGFSVLGEIYGLVGVGLPEGQELTRAERPAEVALGLGWQSSFGLEATLAGGTGITSGYGAPEGRLIAGLRYVWPGRPLPPPDRDSDGDGLVDRVDRCPTVRGPVENQGCPLAEPDSDGDGLPDSADRCPHAAGPRDNGGCPDRDSDGDGIVDRLDKCPDQAGLREHAGCPPPDRDHDGVPDADDRCPDKAGPPENQGCPDFDSDGDGLVDRLDKCPFEAEVYNGVADEDGCPDAGPALATVLDDKIVIFEPVRFVADGTVIDKRSTKLLTAVAAILKAHTELLKVRVEGHTDNRGSAIDNLDLSRERAAAVRRWLIEQGGVDGRRLTAQGFGPDRPIADNRDFVGRAKNRRIEFVVVEKKEVEPP